MDFRAAPLWLLFLAALANGAWATYLAADLAPTDVPAGTGTEHLARAEMPPLAVSTAFAGRGAFPDRPVAATDRLTMLRQCFRADRKHRTVAAAFFLPLQSLRLAELDQCATG